MEIVLAALGMVIIVSNILFAFYKTGSHTSWDKHAELKEDAEIIRCSVDKIYFPQACLRTTVAFSDSFRFVTYNCSKANDGAGIQKSLDRAKQIELMTLASIEHTKAIQYKKYGRSYSAEGEYV